MTILVADDQTNTSAMPSLSLIQGGSTATIQGVTSIPLASLVDPSLLLAAEIVDDLEKVRIANENRLRQLTRVMEDADGVERGFGLDERHPDVRNLAQMVDALGQLEHRAVLNVRRQVRRGPFGPWLATQRGVGEKQLARFLAAIGDPAINTQTGSWRTLPQLRAYCGYHVLPVDQIGSVNGHPTTVDGSKLARGGADHHDGVNQDTPVGVAPRRQRGVQANWSETARTRLYLITVSALKAGNREVYDRRKAATVGKVHRTVCVRCGPSGRPAEAGTPWSDGHRHADALRVQGKHLLRLLWQESRRLHREMENDV